MSNDKFNEEKYQLFKDDYDIKRRIDEPTFELCSGKPSISDLHSYKNGEIKFFKYSDGGVDYQDAIIRIEDKLYRINLQLLED